MLYRHLELKRSVDRNAFRLELVFEIQFVGDWSGWTGEEPA